MCNCMRLCKNCIQKTFVITVLHINRTFLVANNFRCFKITQTLCRAVWCKVQVTSNNSFDLPVAASLVEIVDAGVDGCDDPCEVKVFGVGYGERVDDEVSLGSRYLTAHRCSVEEDVDVNTDTRRPVTHIVCRNLVKQRSSRPADQQQQQLFCK